MLKVTVEVVPGGWGAPQEVATLKISNVSDLRDLSDHIWELEYPSEYAEKGEVKGHYRSNGWEPLVHTILGQVRERNHGRLG